MAVLVRERGRTIFARGYGVRDLRGFAPIDPRTNFRLASVTKQFTAAAIMLLVHDGKLRYTDRLTDIFPEFPPYGQAITIRHLLTHTSGLPDYEELMERGNGGWTAAHPITDAEALQLLERERSPKFSPGSSWSYSNSGYVVLGLIISKIAGEPFGDFLRRRIFHPLGMNHTLVFIAGENTVQRRAYGHVRREGHFVESDQSATSSTLGDGGVYSNVHDLAKWDAALERHSLMSASEMADALTPVKLADGSETRWPIAPSEDNLAPGKPVQYGFGWFLDPYRGRARMWHSGTTQGFRTVIERFTSERLTVIVLCNRTDLDAPRLALRAADELR